jgi:hypothetical protein
MVGINKEIEEMSSAELYELAKLREDEEKERQKEMYQQKIEVLKLRKREITAEYKRGIKEIESEMQTLLGNKQRRKKPAPAGTGKMQATQQVVEYLGGVGEANTQQIRTYLEGIGIDVANLSQLLAYLKRMGRITSPKRAVYKVAGGA